MRKTVTVVLKSLIICALFLQPFMAEAQKSETTPTSGDFLITIRNIEQTDSKNLEFDICILKTTPGLNLELASFQLGIRFNTNILNGAGQTPGMAQILAGTSELSDSLVPLTVNTALSGHIRMAGRPTPKKGGGTIIPDNDKGLRICRLRFTNSVPFAGNSAPEFSFTSNSVDLKSYATRVAVFSGTGIIQLDVNPGKNALVKESIVLSPGSGQ